MDVVTPALLRDVRQRQCMRSKGIARQWLRAALLRDVRQRQCRDRQCEGTAQFSSA
jgi:hypothetical protein